MPLFAGPGVTPSLRGLTSNVINLQAGQTWMVPPGWFLVKPGRFTSFQEYDPITTMWRKVGAGPSDAMVEYSFSDGQNYRLANQTGCAVGARVVVAGSGYTSAPAVTVSAGSSIWKPIIGGAISTSVTVTNAGSNYNYPPAVVFSAPPSPGVQATGYCTLSNNTISSVTVVDQGAGYVTPPTVQFVNDPREGQNGVGVGVNAAAVTTLTGAGTMTALLCLDHGNPIATGTVPTFTFSGGGGSNAAAVAIPCWTITGFTVNSNGTGYSGALALITPLLGSGFTTSTAAYLNPTIEQNLIATRNATLFGTVITGAIFAQSGTGFGLSGLIDGGVYPGAPNNVVIQSLMQSGAGATAAFTFSYGGQNSDASLVLTL